MKRNRIKPLALSLALLLGGQSLPPLAMASGIPTVSIAELTQMIMDGQRQAQEALDQLTAARDAIAQAKSQYENYKGMVTGNNKLGDFLNDPTLNSLLPVSDWQDLYSRTKDLTDLRSRYGLTSSNSKIQAAFDKLLSQAGVLEDQYKATNKRVKTAEGLRTQLNTVQTPGEREQLALRYQQESLELKNQQAQLDNSRYLMEQKDKIEDTRRAQAFEDYMLGKSKTRPTYQ
ncbi:conjugal transfer protein [Erwinia sp. OLTSP20]|uniref:type IV secretion system protein n=1 Tax=Enterobacterales TaxID=91347 RepID=UPI000C183E7A|nr:MULTISPECIES: type IV secretion system protein [Enterobacterales]PII85143.1 conjugal transfer protein [Serratia sp. OLFL2]PIJ49370.1 conjugal transfer protein [Erwinia sp. OAMSP11]PIJ69765.1 conjugal transfer protein [Erwinia sp. OLSSP12]PIJ76211.1 conjugal transfer protein [Erwinia sp. OLCASP19]PIJ76732.1 conjugal transfer protein [Erwinia sp. OLMTSP26]